MGFEFTTKSGVPDEAKQGEEHFKMEGKGTKTRIGMCWFPQDEDGEWDATSIKFVGEHVHFIDKMGYILANPEIDEIVGEPGRPRIATFVVHYDTNKKGEPTKPLDWKVKPWFLSAQKLDNLMEHNADRPLHKVDLVVKMTNPEYQNMEFFPRNEALWQLKDEMRKTVLSKVRSMQRKIRIGRKVTPDELREHLGIEVDASKIGGADDVPDEDFDDMLDNV